MNNLKKEITTKAAKCPNCQKYHLISSITFFNLNKETRESFEDLELAGFSIIEVTTDDAKKNFGYCDISTKDKLTEKDILSLGFVEADRKYDEVLYSLENYGELLSFDSSQQFNVSIWDRNYIIESKSELITLLKFANIKY